MIAYKLVRQMKDGSLASLFINKTARLPVGEWMHAENHPTEGFKQRMGWHCTAEPHAPHLSTKGRVWVMVEIRGYTVEHRPASQGGRWYLAQQMRIIHICDMQSLEKQQEK